MPGFTKLFSSIVDSTIWREDDKTRIVWVTMLAKADRAGRVLVSVPGLADAARVSLDECVSAIGKLSSPDAWSRSTEHGGRRIEGIDGGFRLLNYAKYREIRNGDERREQVREAVARHRAKQAKVINPVIKTSKVSQSNPIAEAEAEAEADLESNGTGKRESVSAEPQAATAPPPVFLFPVTGDPAKPTWGISPARDAEMRAAFPGVNLDAEYKKALAWLNANPSRRKTARGMSQFLFRWCERAQNSGVRNTGALVRAGQIATKEQITAAAAARFMERHK